MGGFFSGLFRKPGIGHPLDPAAPLPPAPDLGMEAVIDRDDRRIVTDVTVAPWRPLVALRLLYPDGKPAIGTGLLIAPDLVLTAAHNLYALDIGAFVSSVLAQAGVKDGQPAAEARGARVEVCPGYQTMNLGNPSRYALDFGVIRLDSRALFDWAQSAVDVLAQPPLPDSELAQSRLNVAGYPDSGGPIVLKTADGPPAPGGVGPTNFSYEMDTEPGQSGGPVFRFDKATGAIRFAGVHVAGGREANIARRYDEAMKRQVAQWKKALGA